MTTYPWNGARNCMLGLIGTVVAIGSAFAVPPTLNSSGLSPQQCYRRDSDCTQFCGDVTGDRRYECFGICDRMLDRCLSTGEWTDSREVEPGSGRPPAPGGELSAFFIRMLMILGDTDGDGETSPKEIQSLKDRVLQRPVPTTDIPQAPAGPTQQ